MPNWTETYLKLKGSKNDCLNLLNRFISEEQSGMRTPMIFYREMPWRRNGLYDRKMEKRQLYFRKFFYRSFTFQTAKSLRDAVEETYDAVNQCVEVIVACAWSVEGCLVLKGGGIFSDRPPADLNCVSIMDICKLYNVACEIYSDEPGMGFVEELSVNNNGNITRDCSYDMASYVICPACEEYVYYGAYREQIELTESDLNKLICEECGHVGLVRRYHK
jgi:hypothetical protein